MIFRLLRLESLTRRPDISTNVMVHLRVIQLGHLKQGPSPGAAGLNLLVVRKAPLFREILGLKALIAPVVEGATGLT